MDGRTFFLYHYWNSETFMGKKPKVPNIENSAFIMKIVRRETNFSLIYLRQYLEY